MRNYYTYAYLRPDGTPYYIGKGSGKRAWKRNAHESACPPPDRILILKKNLTEEEAFTHEKYMIFIFGRKDTGKGILWNFTDGGEGAAGCERTVETRRKMAESKFGENNPMKRPEVRAKASAARKGKPNPSQSKKIKGRKWWVSIGGETAQQRECPGEGWVRGRIWPGKNC